MADEMSVQCKCTPGEGHATVRGKAGTELQNYPKLMCKKLAKAMLCTEGNDQVDFDDAFIVTNFTEAMCSFPAEEEFELGEVDSGYKFDFRMAFALVLDEPPTQCDMAEAEDFVDGDIEKKEYAEILRTLREKFDFETIRAVSKMHVMLGHPSTRALTTSLELMGAKDVWTQCARLYSCEDCLKRQRPKSVRAATLPKASSFNEVVDTDNFHCLWKDKKRIINVIMDEYSRFESDHRIPKETAACEIRVFEKYWLPWAGSPTLLRTDMSGAHMSEKYKCWSDMGSSWS